MNKSLVKIILTLSGKSFYEYKGKTGKIYIKLGKSSQGRYGTTIWYDGWLKF